LANATVEDAGPCKKLLKVVVPAGEVAEKIDESYKKLCETVNVDGFRKGRVPRKLLEKRFGEKVIEEVKETAMADASQEALEQNSLTLIGEPSFDKVEYAAGGDLTFEVTVEVKPQFDLPDYSGLKLRRMSAEVTDQDVADGLARIALRRARYQPVADGEARLNDRLVVSWQAACEGEPVASEADATIVVGARRLGFLDVDLRKALEGAKAGETREADVKFRSDHPIEKHRGKDGKLSITVKELQRPVPAEIDDELAKALDFDSLEQLKSVLCKQLAARKEREVRADLERQASDRLLEQVNIELPEGLVKRQASDLLTREQLRMGYEGIPEEEIEERLAQMQAASEDAAQRQFRLYFLFEKIAEKEKIFVTENDIENRVAQLANSYRQSAQRMREQLEKENALGQLRIQMREERVLDFLLSKAEIQDAGT